MARLHRMNYLRWNKELFGQDCDVQLYTLCRRDQWQPESKKNQQVVRRKMKFHEFECHPQGWGDQNYFAFDDMEILRANREKFGQDCDVPLYTLCRRDQWQPESRINQQVVRRKMKKWWAQASVVKQQGKCLCVCSKMFGQDIVTCHYVEVVAGRS